LRLILLVHFASNGKIWASMADPNRPYHEERVNAHDGESERADAPTRVEVHPDGNRIEEWRRDGHLHRIGGPAYIAIRADGTRYEGWYRDGKLHRTDGPAWIEVHADGSRSERWYRDDFPDRDDGPACVIVRADGTRIEEWWIRGHQNKQKSFLTLSRVPATIHPPARSRS
jgi:hypothetical protein